MEKQLLEEVIKETKNLIAAPSCCQEAKEVEAHAKEIKAAGAKYCDCPACSAVEAILSKLK